MAYTTWNTVLFPVMTVLSRPSLVIPVCQMTLFARQTITLRRIFFRIHLLKNFDLVLSTVSESRFLLNDIAKILPAIERKKSVSDSDPAVSATPE